MDYLQSSVVKSSSSSGGGDYFDRGFNKIDAAEGYRYDQVPSKTSRADNLDDFPSVDFRTEPQSNILTSDTVAVKSDDSISFNEAEDYSLFEISPLVRNNLVKVIEQYPHGIIAVKFSSCYERVTGKRFDLHSLGFTSLCELVDAVPDILVRRPFNGSKKDWIIYSAKSVPNEVAFQSNFAESGCSVMFFENIILNVRKLLQANPEGIPLSKFMHHYSINCIEPLYVSDLGFDNLESLLKSIAIRVPLQILNIKGEKTVNFMGFEEAVIKLPVSPNYKPSNIAPLNAKFKPIEFGSNFDYSKFFPVKTSFITDPGHLYIQFVGKEYGDKLDNLCDELEQFYSSKESDNYRIHSNDIKVGLACIALWPVDENWYRARITSIVSLDVVQVFYEDYGNIDEIHITALRYIKMDYMDLPSQAVKSRLAYLKAPSTPGELSSSWGVETRRRMHELCSKRTLMARVEKIDANGIYALVLCDTNSEGDLYVNDTLIEEQLAEGEEYDEPQVNASAISSALTQNIQQNLMDFMAKLKLANAVSSSFPNPLPNLPLNSTLKKAPPGFAPNQPLVNQQIDQPPVHNNLNSSASSSGLSNPNQCPNYLPEFQMSDVSPAINIPKPEARATSPKSSDDDEIFDDEADDYFEQLCQRNLYATNQKFVKRVKTTDGYFFHVLLWESKPYISSGDLSILIWNSHSSDYLFHKLQVKDVALESVNLTEDGNEEFFRQLQGFRVKGVEKISNESTVLLHPLSKTNYILNIFGHPSATLRAKIKYEIATFNPTSSLWQELPDSETAEEIEELKLETDDDKMNRLCLHDLKVMREGIRCKMKKIHQNKDTEQKGPDLEEEANKLNQLFTKVREKIYEIEQICTLFAS